MSDVQVPRNSQWSTSQVYIIGAICLLLGFPAGYLFHGGPAAAAPSQAVAPSAPAAAMSGGQPTPEQLKHMADTSAQPVLAELKSKPNDPALLAKAGNVYYDAQQYQEAIKYYDRSLKADPKNPNVRTDMATAYFYLGDSDRALAEINEGLRSNPTHAQSLLNLGLIKWQAKMDIEGALAAWQKLLDTNPKFEQADQVKQMIAQVQKHANLKPGSKSAKPLQ